MPFRSSRWHLASPHAPAPVALRPAGLVLTACAPAPSPQSQRAEPVRPQVFRPTGLAAIDAAVLAAIANGAAPGAVVWIERDDSNYRRAYGQRAILPSPEPMTEDSLFDAASLTKVLATTSGHAARRTRPVRLDAR
jgi:CubicO group peptidase (beta-lactamase class C family)